MLRLLATARWRLAGVSSVWRRNATVWLKSWKTSIVGSVGEPLFYVLGLGYGLGTVVPDIGGTPYLRYVAPGLMISSVMQSVTIEATYMIYTKMEHQRVYASMILSPLTFGEILLGEILWIVTKGMVCGGTVLALLLVFGIGPVWPGILGVPLMFVAGLIFTSLGLIVTSLSSSYGFFNYYFTLFLGPMFFFSGVFFPVRNLGPWFERLSLLFPLTHLVRVSRSLLGGTSDAFPSFSLAVAILVAVASFAAASVLMRRRFMP